MNDKSETFRSTIRGKGVIPSDKMLRLMKSDSIEMRALAMEALIHHQDRIRPDLNANECHEFVLGYYLDCIKTNPSSDEYVHSRYEAAGELVRLFEHWRNIEPARSRPLLNCLVDSVGKLYLIGDAGIRLAIETGFLEHVFEKLDARQHFETWQESETLSMAISESLTWRRK